MVFTYSATVTGPCEELCRSIEGRILKAGAVAIRDAQEGQEDCRLAASKRVGEYRVVLEVYGRGHEGAASIMRLMRIARDIAIRDIPSEDAPKKPCGCSGG